MKYVAYAVGALVMAFSVESVGWLGALIIGTFVGVVLGSVLTSLPAGSPQKSAIETSNALSQEAVITPEPSDACWAEALAECEEGNHKPALWAKSIAMANGDENVAKASYLKIRASELAAVEAAMLAARSKEQINAQFGICPNCGMKVHLDAESCRHCNTRFLANYRPRKAVG